MKKKVIVMILSLAMVLGCTSSAKAETLYTHGGKSNKNWTMSIFKSSHGGTIHRITGNAIQPDLYKFDNIRIKVVHFCNSYNNQVKTVQKSNVYRISAYADAPYSLSASSGSSCVTVKDSVYGQGTKLIYYK